MPGKAFLPAEGRLEASAIVQPPQGTVSRTALVNRLRVSTASVIALLAPAGYGKSATIAQWSERDDRPFAWVTCGAEDPRGLCVLIASALFQAGVVDRSTLALVRARRGPGPALRELIAAFRSLECSTVLVLDDVHMLRSKGSADVVEAFALHVPNGSAVVLAGRSAPRASLAQVRVRGGLFEVGAEELALSRRDSKRRLRGLGVELAPAAVDDLLRVTEGWPVGVYLAGLALRDGKPSSAVPGGDDRFVTDYLEFEVLSRLDGDDVRFLTHTSVLDELSGPLCDAVLDQEGSGRKLEALCRAGLFVVPLDRRRRSYRYQRAFRDYLRAELERREPHAEAGLFSRASVWCEENGRAEAAVAYAHAAGETDRVAELVGRHALATWARGSREVVETWLGWFDESYDLEGHPEIAVLQAWVHGVAGRPSASERWLALAEGTRLRQALPDGSASIEPWLAVVRAAHCAQGPERMLADADLALDELGPASGWRPAALVLRAAAQSMLGDDDLADATMAEAAEQAESIGVVPSRVVALSQRSLLAAGRGDEDRAAELALEARKLVRAHDLEGYVRSALGFAVSARWEAHWGDIERARAELERARALVPQLSRALPWYSVQAAFELVRVHLRLADAAGARMWLALADSILRRRPLLGVLVQQRTELEAQAERVAGVQDGRASTLTPAELRLLPFLATYLSFREIGENLFVSRNTVKSQAISVYRKLGVSSRSAAIQRAGELGLVGPP